VNPWSPKTETDGRVEYESDEIEEAELDSNPAAQLFRGAKITTTTEQVPRFRLSKSEPTPPEKTPGTGAGTLTYTVRKDEHGFFWREGSDSDGVMKSAMLIEESEALTKYPAAPNSAEPTSKKLLAALRQIISELPAVKDETAQDFIGRLNSELEMLSRRPSLSIVPE